VLALIGALIAYAAAAVGGATPTGSHLGSTIAAGIWLVIAATIVLLGLLRIRSAQYATSRRNAHRVDLDLEVCTDGTPATLADVSTGGAAVLLPPGTPPIDAVTQVAFPGSRPIAMELVRTSTDDGMTRAALRIPDQDWAAYRALSLWLFHTAPGTVPGLPGDAPVIAVTG
jgi:cellulose synthase (UDP-forming)